MMWRWGIVCDATNDTTFLTFRRRYYIPICLITLVKHNIVKNGNTRTVHIILATKRLMECWCVRCWNYHIFKMLRWCSIEITTWLTCSNDNQFYMHQLNMYKDTKQLAKVKNVLLCHLLQITSSVQHKWFV